MRRCVCVCTVYMYIFFSSKIQFSHGWHVKSESVEQGEFILRLIPLYRYLYCLLEILRNWSFLNFFWICRTWRFISHFLWFLHDCWKDHFTRTSGCQIYPLFQSKQTILHAKSRTSKVLTLASFAFNFPLERNSVVMFAKTGDMKAKWVNEIKRAL